MYAASISNDLPISITVLTVGRSYRVTSPANSIRFPRSSVTDRNVVLTPPLFFLNHLVLNNDGAPLSDIVIGVFKNHLDGLVNFNAAGS